MANRKTNIDPYAFALDVVSGELTRSQIAEKWGISDDHVGEIIRGESRDDIGEIIRALGESAKEHARARLAMLQDMAVGTVLSAMLGDAKAVALQAAREVLNRTMGDPSKTDLHLTQSQTNEYPGLGPDALAAIAKLKEGPK